MKVSNDGSTRPAGQTSNGSRADTYERLSMEYDEDGSLTLARALGNRPKLQTDEQALSRTPLPVGALNGSWYLQFTPQGPHTLTEIRGPLRIEVAPPKLRASGDIYVHQPIGGGAPIDLLRPITERPLFFGDNWYPHLPFDQYSWYFRSLGIQYQSGTLVIKIKRHLWNRITQEFITQQTTGQDNAFLQLECFEENLLTHPLLPAPALRLLGTANIGGVVYDAVATKTSPFYRGCAVEVDVMKNRSFPISATTAAGAAVSFATIYRTAGMDCAVEVNETDLVDDPQLTTIELQTALTSNRRPVNVPEAWRLWLMVGSAQGGLFGLMFDDTSPFREGTAGFFDPRLSNDAFVAPSARGKKLGEVPAAFLRTLVHEAGHAFNLFHPKHDVHSVPIGTTIMNQTGDVMGFATPANPYPGNITFAFDDHNRTSLIHSPDPQVAPGWKRFGWGHGSLSSGIPEPVDAAGFLAADRESGYVTLDLTIPKNIYRGQFVTAQFTLTNRSAEPQSVTSAINLSQGDLRLLVTPPAEELHDVRDVIVACGDRPMITLVPGDSITGSAQIFYTNVGFTFRQIGRYFVSAELDLGNRSGTIARSNTVTVVVHAPSTKEEIGIAELSMQIGVGRAFALGDFGLDKVAEQSLETLAKTFKDSETGIAAALTLANAKGRALRSLRDGKPLRKVDSAGANRYFNQAATAFGGDFNGLVHASAAVAAPTETGAPVLNMAHDYLVDASSTASADTSTAEAGQRSGRGRKTASDDSAGTPVADRATAAVKYLNSIRRTFPPE